MITGVLLAQLTTPLDLDKATTLRTGEVVRYYQRGGRTRNGIYQVLVVATSKRVYVKTNEFAATLEMEPADRSKLYDALQTSDPKSLLQKKRANPGFPSMADGTDVFLTYRNPKSKGLVTWNNEAYEVPEFKLFMVLDGFVDRLRPNP
jgi:hypothetical protein